MIRLMSPSDLPAVTTAVFSEGQIQYYLRRFFRAVFACQTNICAGSQESICPQTNICAACQASICLQTNICAGSQKSICLQTNMCAASQKSICFQTNICAASQKSSCLPGKYLHRFSKKYLPADKYLSSFSRKYLLPNKYLRSFSKKYLLPDKYLRRFSREYLPARQVANNVFVKIANISVDQILDLIAGVYFNIILYKMKLHSSCEIEDFVETHLRKPCDTPIARITSCVSSLRI